MRVFWNAPTAAARGDYIPNSSSGWFKPNSGQIILVLSTGAINVSPTQYTDNSVAAAFKYFALLPLFPPNPGCCCADCPPEIYSSRQNGFLLLAMHQCASRPECNPAMHCTLHSPLLWSFNSELLHQWWPTLGAVQSVHIWSYWCSSGGKFTQDWDLWALGQLAQQGAPVTLHFSCILDLHSDYRVTAQKMLYYTSTEPFSCSFMHCMDS